MVEMQSIHTMMTSSKGNLDAIYPALLATINNVAPYLQNLKARPSAKLMQLFISMSAPSFLLANETNYALLQSLLESLNAIIEHQYPSKSAALLMSSPYSTLCLGNRVFVQTLLKTRKRFQALRSFTLESGQEEIERQKRRRKESADGAEDLTSPTRSMRSSSHENLRSPQSVRTPSLSNVPEEGGTFTIGDDEDSDDENAREPANTPSYSSPSHQNSQTPSRSSSVDEPLPTQLRGMSEKARGKMPAKHTAFSRQSSSTSLNSHAATISSPAIGFNPSAHWVSCHFVRCQGSFTNANL